MARLNIDLKESIHVIFSTNDFVIFFFLGKHYNFIIIIIIIIYILRLYSKEVS